MADDGRFNPFAPDEPARDDALGALLRRGVGEVPMGAVDWNALAARIAGALPARASVAWWSYTERWSRRILPVALAASLVGAIMLWNADVASAVPVGAADVVAEVVVQGVPVEDAARTFARSMTADATFIAADAE